MGRISVIKTHPNRWDIGADLVRKAMGSGESYSTIADRYGVALTTLKDYANGPFLEEMAQWRQAYEWASANNLQAELQTEKETIRRLRERAEDEDDLRTALYACDKALKALELEAKIEQVIQTAPQVNLVLTPQWQELVTILDDALAERHPEAHRDLMLSIEAARG